LPSGQNREMVPIPHKDPRRFLLHEAGHIPVLFIEIWSVGFTWSKGQWSDLIFDISYVIIDVCRAIDFFYATSWIRLFFFFYIDAYAGHSFDFAEFSQRLTFGKALFAVEDETDT
jgi:hypothetical protein